MMPLEAGDDRFLADRHIVSVNTREPGVKF
jgi:hypothetical protein